MLRFFLVRHTVPVPVNLPGGGVRRVAAHRSRDRRIPAREHITFPLRCAIERGRCLARQQVIHHLVGEDFLAVHPVGVGHGISLHSYGAALRLPCGAEAAVRRLEPQENDIFFAILEPGDQAVAILVQNGGRVRRGIARRREAKVIRITQRRVDAQPVNVCNQRERLHLAALRPGGYGQRGFRARIGVAIPGVEADGNLILVHGGLEFSARHRITAFCEGIVPSHMDVPRRKGKDQTNLILSGQPRQIIRDGEDDGIRRVIHGHAGRGKFPVTARLQAKGVVRAADGKAVLVQKAPRAPAQAFKNVIAVVERLRLAVHKHGHLDGACVSCDMGVAAKIAGLQDGALIANLTIDRERVRIAPPNLTVIDQRSIERAAGDGSRVSHIPTIENTAGDGAAFVVHAATERAAGDGAAFVVHAATERAAGDGSRVSRVITMGNTTGDRAGRFYFYGEKRIAHNVVQVHRAGDDSRTALYAISSNACKAGAVRRAARYGDGDRHHFPGFDGQHGCREVKSGGLARLQWLNRPHPCGVPGCRVCVWRHRDDVQLVLGHADVDGELLRGAVSHVCQPDGVADPLSLGGRFPVRLDRQGHVRRARGGRGRQHGHGFRRGGVCRFRCRRVGRLRRRRVGRFRRGRFCRLRRGHLCRLRRGHLCRLRRGRFCRLRRGRAGRLRRRGAGRLRRGRICRLRCGRLCRLRRGRFCRFRCRRAFRCARWLWCHGGLRHHGRACRFGHRRMRHCSDQHANGEQHARPALHFLHVAFLLNPCSGLL